MATVTKPEMPILRETPDQIYQRIANRMAEIARQRGQTPLATEEGELFYDLLYPLAIEISEQQQLLEYGFLQRFLPWADGEFLDANGVFFGLPRLQDEPDEPYKNRLIERARTEEGDGRRIDYERWARNIEGVGGAVAIEKERHDLSIDVYIIDLNGQPATPDLAQQVRGKLEDKRRALHDLQVLPATLYPVTVGVRLVLRADALLEIVQAEITSRIKSYLKERSEIVYHVIGSLFFVDGVEDFSDYTLNGGEVNLAIPSDAVASLELVVTT